MTNEASPTKKPRAVLVGLLLPGVSDDDNEASLAELGRLVHTLGYEVVGTISQRRATPAAEAVVGAGKLREIARFTGGSGKVTLTIPGRKKSKVNQDDDDDDDDDRSAAELAAEAMALSGAAAVGDEDSGPLTPLPEDQRAAFVIFDNEVSPTQLRNLETALDAEVLDRTGVIVEIFYRHAKTRAAKLQVEIARLRYLTPRLRLSRGPSERQGAGIGAKGAGETAHELDKRRVRDRIAELQRELEDIHASQSGRRQRRSDQAKVALVGYTNAGKSSLMRALTGSEVLVQDKLFATLDTTIRAMQPETLPRVLVSDTVGFIKKLPHDLVASFRSTLDEAQDASLLLYVADASDKTFRSQLLVTQDVIAEIGGGDLPSRLILNKCDRLDQAETAALKAEYPDAIMMSTHRKDDVARLRELILEFFETGMTEVDLLVPYERSNLTGEIRRTFRVLRETHGETGTTLRVKGFPQAVEKMMALLTE